MKYKVLPLVGYKALRAFNAFNSLLLGLKMLPAYISISFEEFHEMMSEKTEDQKRKLIIEAIMFVQLDKEEVEALISFSCDSNGIPFSPVNASKLPIKDMQEIMTEVCMEIGRIKIDLVTDTEKKTFQQDSLT